MEIRRLHDWDLKPREAIALQEQLAGQLIGDAPFDSAAIRSVAGVDVSVKRQSTCACVVVLSFPQLEPLETVCVLRETSYPYIPGLLTFREGPALVAAFRQLEHEPDVFLFDGMGQLHPRRMGIAAHLGLWLERPTIGCGKSHYIGEYQQPGPEKGSKSKVMFRGQQLGVVLRTRRNVKPVYISVGHMAALESAIDLVLACTPKFRLPRPIRLAHRAAAEYSEATQ